MGRPRIYDEPRVATAIRLPTSLHEELRAAAAERDVSVNVLVNRAVQAYLRREPAPS
jgi:predicted HicB family RNase H-like nuclease